MHNEKDRICASKREREKERKKERKKDRKKERNQHLTKYFFTQICIQRDVYFFIQTL